VPVNRDATLKKAENLLRQGKLAGAIDEYVRLVEDQPTDWNSINALGDLYARAGDVDRAVAQFTAVADHLYDEGFYPKASALYKKALKTKSNHEHSLARLLDIARLQGLTAEAKTYQQALWHVRGVDAEAPVPVTEDVTVEDIRIEPVAFVDADTLPLPEGAIESESAPSYLVEEEDSDDRFVVTAADLREGEAMLHEDPVGTVSPDTTPVIEQAEQAPTLEDVFGQMRARVVAQRDANATEQYERGMRHLDEGRFDEALDDLQASARSPALRFKAASSLGRALASRGEYKDAVDWMERAAEAPPASVDESRSLLYDLSDALERLGEHGRAMAVLLELQADAGAYRDVAERIEHLRGMLQGSSRA
jgi:tetratricopeptide (TPR) repeat protein